MTINWRKACFATAIALVVVYKASSSGAVLSATDVIRQQLHKDAEADTNAQGKQIERDLGSGKINFAKAVEEYHSTRIVNSSNHNSVDNLPKGCPENETFWVNGKKTMDVSACEVGQVFQVVLAGPGTYSARFGEKFENGTLKGELLDEPIIEPFPSPSQYGANIAKKIGPKTYELFGDVKYVHQGIGNVLELTKK